MSVEELLTAKRAEAARVTAELRDLEAAVAQIRGDLVGPAVINFPTFDAEDLEFQWLVGGMIAAQTVTMLVADPGIGKSTLMAQLTLAAASGRPFLAARIEEPMRVLMLQAEGSRAAFRARVRSARSAMGVVPPNLWHIHAPDFTDFQIGSDGLLRAVKESDARLVVMDTIGYFAKFKENDSEEWKFKVMRPLRRLIGETGCSVILVHHQPKQTEANKESRDGRGTSAMLADCDHFWKLETVKDEPALRDFVVRKNKYGAEGTQRLSFDAGNALFRVVT